MQNEFQSYIWKKEYEIGLEDIDNQHKELFKRIDKLLLAMYDGKEKSELYQLGKFMIEYIEDHFSDEEELMLRIHYSDSRKHINEHKEFIKIYNVFKDEIANKGASIYLANRMLKELRKWWEHHILKSDMLFKPYIKKTN